MSVEHEFDQASTRQKIAHGQRVAFAYAATLEGLKPELTGRIMSGLAGIATALQTEADADARLFVDWLGEERAKRLRRNDLDVLARASAASRAAIATERSITARLLLAKPKDLRENAEHMARNTHFGRLLALGNAVPGDREIYNAAISERTSQFVAAADSGTSAMPHGELFEAWLADLVARGRPVMDTYFAAAQATVRSAAGLPPAMASVGFGLGTTPPRVTVTSAVRQGPAASPAAPRGSRVRSSLRPGPGANTHGLDRRQGPSAFGPPA